MVAAFAPHFPEYSLFRNPNGDWQYQAICALKPDPGLIEALDRLIQLICPDRMERLHYTIEPLPERDWLADNQTQCAPFACKRFTIVPGGTKYDAVDSSSRMILKINGSLAFGTGRHATTQLCLSSLAALHKRMPRQIRRILDVGTGSGILSIAAAKLFPAARIDAVDIADEAMAAVRENWQANHLTPQRLGLHKTNGRVLPQAKPYDLLMANILQQPLIDCQRVFARTARKNSPLLLSGFLPSQTRAIDAHYRKNFTLRETLVRHDWAALVYQRK